MPPRSLRPRPSKPGAQELGRRALDNISGGSKEQPTAPGRSLDLGIKAVFVRHGGTMDSAL
jgi:hypothetical protein